MDGSETVPPLRIVYGHMGYRKEGPRSLGNDRGMAKALKLLFLCI